MKFCTSLVDMFISFFRTVVPRRSWLLSLMVWLCAPLLLSVVSAVTFPAFAVLAMLLLCMRVSLYILSQYFMLLQWCMMLQYQCAVYVSVSVKDKSLSGVKWLIVTSYSHRLRNVIRLSHGVLLYGYCLAINTYHIVLYCIQCYSNCNMFDKLSFSHRCLVCLSVFMAFAGLAHL